MFALNTWLQKAQTLLYPSSIPCLICGKNSRLSSGLPGVCMNCEASIPWIRSPRCSKCGRHVGCPDCSRSSEPGPIVCNRSSVAYTSVMRETLGQYKYRGNERLAPLLGLMLDRAYAILQKERAKAGHNAHSLQLPSFLSSRSGQRGSSVSLWQADLLVPVPVSDSRLAERGFNQAERLADVLSMRRGIPQLPLLIRTHHTGKQSFKSRAERLNDMKHAFAANPDPSVRKLFAERLDSIGPQIPARPLQIIIIDDIYTTGSTIRACAESLNLLTGSFGCLAEIYSLTWARS
ncbi:ComF family protein [Paenibacillus sp. HW567]|uniref:ComF family protein n=1 Tax=Paenibacillus sp. HW567 TaxID=1034769 RepID=UPI000369ED57|nr:ComF family protein [Paenibacillus sp. HW567]